MEEAACFSAIDSQVVWRAHIKLFSVIELDRQEALQLSTELLESLRTHSHKKSHVITQRV